jgi:hypothetical protein
MDDPKRWQLRGGARYIPSHTVSNARYCGGMRHPQGMRGTRISVPFIGEKVCAASKLRLCGPKEVVSYSRFLHSH